MSGSFLNFSIGGNTSSLAVTGASANVQIAGLGVATGQSVRMFNDGNQVVFFAFGNDNTVATALATGTPIPPNGVELFTIPDGASFVAAIANAVGSTLRLTPGWGS